MWLKLNSVCSFKGKTQLCSETWVMTPSDFYWNDTWDIRGKSLPLKLRLQINLITKTGWEKSSAHLVQKQLEIPEQTELWTLTSSPQGERLRSSDYLDLSSLPKLLELFHPSANNAKDGKKKTHDKNDMSLNS